MGSEKWEKYRLGDNCLKIGSGATPRGGQENYKPKGISLIRSQNVLDFTFSKDGLAFIDEKQATELSNVEVQENDILLNITGDSVCRVCQVPKGILPARVNQHVAIIRPERDVFDAAYLKYYLLNPTFKDFMLSLASSGGTRNALTKGMIENFEIFAPDLPTQRRIAAILTALDDKIELNRRMNETLEGIARAAWAEWFGKYASGGEELPEGAIKTTFEEHLDVERGLSYKGQGLVGPEDGIPMYNLNSVLEGGGFKYSGMKYYSGEYKERHLVNPGDLIVTNTEQGHKYLLIGYPAVVPKMYGSGICSHHIYRVRAKPNSYLTSQFFYYLMMHPVVREQIVGCANGTTVNMLKIEGLKIPEFHLPPQEQVQDFSILAQSIWDKQEENTLHSRTLTTLRDALLPRLMQGEVEV